MSSRYDMIWIADRKRKLEQTKTELGQTEVK